MKPAIGTGSVVLRKSAKEKRPRPNVSFRHVEKIVALSESFKEKLENSFGRIGQQASKYLHETTKRVMSSRFVKNNLSRSIMTQEETSLIFSSEKEEMKTLEAYSSDSEDIGYLKNLKPNQASSPMPQKNVNFDCGHEISSNDIYLFNSESEDDYVTNKSYQRSNEFSIDSKRSSLTTSNSIIDMDRVFVDIEGDVLFNKETKPSLKKTINLAEENTKEMISQTQDKGIGNVVCKYHWQCKGLDNFKNYTEARANIEPSHTTMDECPYFNLQILVKKIFL